MTATPDIGSPETLFLVAVVFLLAGLVKGVIGLGLPTVALGLLTATLGLKDAMALMLIPSFATNLWQGLAGSALAALLRRLWLLLVCVCLATWLTAGLLARSDAVALSALLGGLLCLYGGLSLLRPQVPTPGRHEAWLSPVVGLVNGGLTGLTGSFVVPGVLYLQALGMPRDTFVQAMGVLFTVSTLALGASLAGYGLLPADLTGLSAAALAPAFAGMFVGQWLRRRLPEARFRQVFFSGIAALGVYIVARTAV